MRYRVPFEFTALDDEAAKLAVENFNHRRYRISGTGHFVNDELAPVAGAEGWPEPVPGPVT